MMTPGAAGPVSLRALLSHLLPLLQLLLHVPPVRVSSPRGHPARHFGRIPENSPAGTPVVGVVLPVGAGGCPGGDLDIGLKGDYVSDFRLVQYRGHRDQRGHLGLVTTKVLDREFIAMYELTVELPPRCLGRPAAVRVQVQVQVEVSDINDNVPQFTSGNKTVEVDELTPLGAEVASFDAKDGDSGNNGRVRFYASPQSDLLHVVPQTGKVRLVGSLQGVNQVTARIYAEDSGDVALISEPVILRVIVRRSSRARRTPRELSEELTYTVTVPDQVRIGDLVFTVPDQRFDLRWFEVISEADSPVHIERDSGRLYLARSLLEPAEVVVKIQKLRGKKMFPPHSRSLLGGTDVVLL